MGFLSPSARESALRDQREMLGQRRAEMVALARPDGQETKDAQMALSETYLDPDEYNFRMIGGTYRDMYAYQHSRAQALSYRLWRENPLAKRIIELETDIVCGDGFSVSSPDDALDEVLQTHWNHPANNWKKYLYDYVREISIWGEILLPVSIGPVDGLVLLGWIDPSNISGVLKCSQNSKFDGQVVLRHGFDSQPETLEIIRHRLDMPDEGAMGDAFFFRRNSPIGATRGVPDLYPLVDWLDGHDRVLFDQMERVGLLNAFVWDVTLQGADQNKINEWAKNRKAPRPGSVRVHNENEKWDQVTPNIGQGDVSEAGLTTKRHILAGRGLPGHWFADPEDANRATATKMDFSAVKTLGSRQRQDVDQVHFIMCFVRDQAISARTIRRTKKSTINVSHPMISEEDMVRVAESYHQTVQALAIARVNGWTSDSQAIKILCGFSAKFGVEMSEEEVRRDLDAVPTADMEPYRRATEKARNKAKKNGDTG